MKRLILLLGFSGLLIALGFNTLDAMINTFYWQPANYSNGIWNMNTWFKWDFWNCYMVFGILPLGSGCMLFGFIFGRLWNVRLTGVMGEPSNETYIGEVALNQVPAERPTMSLKLFIALMSFAALFIGALYALIQMTL